MTKRTIVFFTPQMLGGGAEKITNTIMKLLDKSLFDVHLITLSKEGPAFAHVPNDVTVHILNSSKTMFSLLKLRKTIVKLKPDILFSSLFRGHIALTLALSGIKRKPYLIFRSPNSPKLLINNNQISYIYRSFIELAYRKSNKIIAQTPEMKDEIAFYHQIHPNKIELLINPIDQDDIDQKTLDCSTPFNSQYINIVAAGRLDYQKGFDVLIKSFVDVVKQNPLYRLFIIGDGAVDEKTSLQTLVSTLGLSEYITFLGYKTNPYPYYKYANAYVLSSRWEGLPNVVLEALYLQTPVIATRCIPFLSELIHEGENGFLVNVEDSDDLSYNLLNLDKIQEKFDLLNNSKEQINKLFNVPKK